ncbi:hypothetical protein PCL_08376 [Purpureocillium lilacinum]|uniref:Uncharacterized protein n=1 Tax=Purpureocillium lilacinum TaxID=33203 RepID=A0A2U3DRY6_PURLI|nr:hypothetical protein PCL_08376 [Purpureocillium lilacinum]
MQLTCLEKISYVSGAMTSQERMQEINELKAKHLIELACVPLDALSFPFSTNLNNGNIERLREAFRGARCFNEKEEYLIPAIISRQDFDKGVITKRNAHRPALFDPAPGMKLQCLRGLHRVRAAQTLCYPPERWLVAIYDSEHIGYKATRDLEEEYDLAKIPSDGHFYYKIRLYEGRHGNESDCTLAGWWYARLNGHPRDRNAGRTMERLNKHPLYDSALNGLHRIEALYSAYRIDSKIGFSFGSIPRLLTLGCREELIDTSLRRLKDFWHDVFDGDESIMRGMDASSVTVLEGMAPGAIEEHWATLSGLVKTGKVFTALDKKSRRRCFKRLCSATRRVQVPSFGVFFKNLTYFETLKSCLNRLVDDPQDETVCNYKAKGRRANRDRDESIRSAFKRAFSFRDCQRLIQVDESNMVRVRIDDEKIAFDVAYRQLWLFAIRRQADMPIRQQPKKVGPRGDPANRAVLYEFALLAQTLGFMNPTIRRLLDPTQHPDRAAVRQMLEDTRKGYSYPDIERSISACLAQMNSAVPASKKVQSNDPECGDKVKLWGRPWDAHATADRPRLYLHTLHRPWDGRQERSISSYFVARSQYFSWFGEELDVELSISDTDPRVPLYGESRTLLENNTPSPEMDERPDGLQEHEDRLTALKEEERQLEGQLKATKEALEEDVSRLRSEREQLKQDKTKLKDKMKDIHARNKKAVDQNESLKSESKRLEEVRNGLHEKVKSLDEEIADLERKRESLIGLLCDLEQEYGEWFKGFRAVNLENQDQPEMVDADTVSAFEPGDDDDTEPGFDETMAGLDTEDEYGQGGDMERDEDGHDTDMDKGSDNEPERGVVIRFVNYNHAEKKLAVRNEASGQNETESIARGLKVEGYRLYVYKPAGSGGLLEIAREVGRENCYRAAKARRDKTILVVLDSEGVPEPRRREDRWRKRHRATPKTRHDEFRPNRNRSEAGTKNDFRRKNRKRLQARTAATQQRADERRTGWNPSSSGQELREAKLKHPTVPRSVRPEPLRPEPLRPEPQPEPERPDPLLPEPRPEPPSQQPPPEPPRPKPDQSTLGERKADEQKRQDGDYGLRSSGESLRVQVVDGHLRLRSDDQRAAGDAMLTGAKNTRDGVRPKRPATPGPANSTLTEQDDEEQEANDRYIKPPPTRGFLRGGGALDPHRGKRRRLDGEGEEHQGENIQDMQGVETYKPEGHVEPEGAESDSTW